MSIITIILNIITAIALTIAPAPSTTVIQDDLPYPYCPTTLCLTDSTELQSQAYSTLEDSAEIQNLEVPYGHEISLTLLGYIDAPEYTEPSTLDLIQVTDSEGTTFVFTYSFESAMLYNV